MRTITNPTPACFHSLFLAIAFFAYSLAPVPGLAQEFQLAADELKAFEGYYQFEQNSNAYLHVTPKGDGLVAKQEWDGKEFFIVPKSALEFYSQKEQFPVKFFKNGSGKVTHAVVLGNDTWKKVANYTPPKIISLSPEKLKAYQGKYTFQFEPGTDSYIHITADENQLILTEQWSGNKIKFSPLSELEFYSKERAFPLKFIKDKNGKVTQVLAFERDLWTRVAQ